MKQTQKIQRLVTTMVCSLVAMTSVAQTATGRPKLVVSIMVDQLRTDYVEYLQSLFTEQGFRRLMRQGAYLRDVDFRPAGLDIVSGTALVYTGAMPNASGVAASEAYNPQTLKREATLNDPAAIGNFTTATYSPRALALSTFSDEIMIDGAGLGLVYSIATDPQQAIVMASHAGTGALWLNPSDGRWSTSTYYKQALPTTVTDLNYRRPLSQRIDTMQWKPLLADLNRYPGIPSQKRRYPFRYTFPSTGRDTYRMWAASPKANEEVTSLAIEYLRSLQLGRRGDAIDMLNVGLTAAPFKYVKDGDYRLELEDTYLRLDRELARLLNAIDKTTGLSNTLIFLSSTGYYNNATADDPKYQIPSGDFSAKRALSLLNAFYTSRHGSGNYVVAFDRGQFHLNRALFEQKGLDTDAEAREGKLFLQRMSGVADAWTLSELLTASDADLAALRLSINPKTAGQIIIAVQPGWNLIDDTVYPSVVTPVRDCAVMTPAFILGPGVEAVTIGTPVDAAALAPTVTGILRIRSPNGAKEKPLF